MFALFSCPPTQNYSNYSHWLAGCLFGHYWLALRLRLPHKRSFLLLLVNTQRRLRKKTRPNVRTIKRVEKGKKKLSRFCNGSLWAEWEEELYRFLFFLHAVSGCFQHFLVLNFSSRKRNIVTEDSDSDFPPPFNSIIYVTSPLLVRWVWLHWEQSKTANCSSFIQLLLRFIDFPALLKNNENFKLITFRFQALVNFPRK